MLKIDLNFYPCKMSGLPKLTVQNKHQRMSFVEWAQNNEVSFNNVWVCDEAHFHLNYVVNKQNVRFWASGNPSMYPGKCIIHQELQCESPSQVMDC
jgi:hypothetical protein